MFLISKYLIGFYRVKRAGRGFRLEVIFWFEGIGGFGKEELGFFYWRNKGREWFVILMVDERRCFLRRWWLVVKYCISLRWVFRFEILYRFYYVILVYMSFVSMIVCVLV